MANYWENPEVADQFNGDLADGTHYMVVVHIFECIGKDPMYQVIIDYQRGPIYNALYGHIAYISDEYTDRQPVFILEATLNKDK